MVEVCSTQTSVHNSTGPPRFISVRLTEPVSRFTPRPPPWVSFLEAPVVESTEPERTASLRQPELGPGSKRHPQRLLPLGSSGWRRPFRIMVPEDPDVRETQQRIESAYAKDSIRMLQGYTPWLIRATSWCSTCLPVKRRVAREAECQHVLRRVTRASDVYTPTIYPC